MNFLLWNSEFLCLYGGTIVFLKANVIFSSPELKAHGELIGWYSRCCLIVRPSIHIFKDLLLNCLANQSQILYD